MKEKWIVSTGEEVKKEHYKLDYDRVVQLDVVKQSSIFLNFNYPATNLGAAAVLSLLIRQRSARKICQLSELLLRSSL
jgi:hypothetical protein